MNVGQAGHLISFSLWLFFISYLVIVRRTQRKEKKGGPPEKCVFRRHVFVKSQMPVFGVNKKYTEWIDSKRTSCIQFSYSNVQCVRDELAPI